MKKDHKKRDVMLQFRVRGDLMTGGNSELHWSKWMFTTADDFDTFFQSLPKLNRISAGIKFGDSANPVDEIQVHVFSPYDDSYSWTQTDGWKRVADSEQFWNRKIADDVDDFIRWAIRVVNVTGDVVDETPTIDEAERLSEAEGRRQYARRVGNPCGNGYRLNKFIGAFPFNIEGLIG